MLTRLDLTNNFVTFLEVERCHMRLTQKQMAKKLGMCVSSYKKLILGNTQKIDLYIAYLLYRINEEAVLRLLGYPDGIGEIVSELRTLSDAQLQAFLKMIAVEKEFLQKHPGIDPEDYVPILLPVKQYYTAKKPD